MVVHYRIIETTPLGKPRQTQRDKWNPSLAVEKYRAYADVLRLETAGYTLPLEVSVRFHLPMPKSWSAKKREAMNGKPHDQKPDVDNLSKALMDALSKEDKTIWHLDARKYWAETGSLNVLMVKEDN